jgi:hypothetical protein
MAIHYAMPKYLSQNSEIILIKNIHYKATEVSCIEKVKCLCPIYESRNLKTIPLQETYNNYSMNVSGMEQGC